MRFPGPGDSCAFRRDRVSGQSWSPLAQQAPSSESRRRPSWPSWSALRAGAIPAAPRAAPPALHALTRHRHPVRAPVADVPPARCRRGVLRPVPDWQEGGRHGLPRYRGAAPERPRTLPPADRRTPGRRPLHPLRECPARGGRAMCEPCREDRRVAKRTRHAARRAAGLCVQCATPAPGGYSPTTPASADSRSKAAATRARV